MLGSRQFTPKFISKITITLNFDEKNKIYVRFGVNWCEPHILRCQLFNLAYYTNFSLPHCKHTKAGF